MVKVKKLENTVKTYGKRKVKEKKDRRPILINSTTYNVTNVFNITNNYFISTSSSGDEFDKLIKQASSKVSCNNPSTSRCSPYGRFVQRQERSTFYHSDATSEMSSSPRLFKDPFGGLNSFSLSHIPTPPAYYKKNKKLVKVVKHTETIKKIRRKRCPKIKRLTNSPHLKKSPNAASSTPTSSLSVTHGGGLWGVNVSPILPPEMPSSPSQDLKLLAIEGSQDTPSRKKYDMSALAAILGKLEIVPSQSDAKRSIGNWHQKKEHSCKKENEPEHNTERSETYKSSVTAGLHDSLTQNMSKNNFKIIELTKNTCEKYKESMLIGQDDSISSENDFLVDEKCNSPMKNQQNHQSLTNESGHNSIKNSFTESPSNRNGVSSLRKSEKVETTDKLKSEENFIEEENDRCLHKNEQTHITGENIEKNSIGVNVGNYSMGNDDSRAEQIEDVNSVFNFNRVTLRPEKHWGKNEIPSNSNRDCNLRKSEGGETIDKFDSEENLIEKENYSCLHKNEQTSIMRGKNSLEVNVRNYSLVNDDSWVEQIENVDSVLNPNRVSLRPGKHWKRSLLQFRQEENRKSSVCTVSLGQRRRTIGPVILAKLVKGASKSFSLDFSKDVNNSFEETLPILKVESALNTITKRRPRGICGFQPLDLVAEEEDIANSVNFDFTLGENTDKESTTRKKERSLDLFEEEEECFYDDFLCSGVKNLTFGEHDDPSHLTCHEEEASNFILENVEEWPIENVKLGVLAHCQQENPLPFTEVFSDVTLSDCKKIGEGVFGEVFMLRRSEHEISVVKIIPVEGAQLVNNEPQKCLDEVLSEIIISGELSSLRNNSDNCTSGFCELKNKFCLKGAYPSRLVELWKKFASEEKSENDCPDMFGCDQLYIALELDHAGQPVESFKFDTAEQAFSVLLQTTFSLGIAELSLEFEHRDLHIGNVLIRSTPEKYISYTLNGSSFQLPTNGVKATIIDFTLSRISFEGDVLFCDLSKDPELFTAEGDYQFEIYRLMRDDLNNNWRISAPITNIRWLDYLADKLITRKTYKKKKLNIHKQSMNRLNRLRNIILDFQSSADLSEYLLESYKETIDIIRAF